ncbi:hypothetical protein F5B21DRAFT_270861 [Xylaria acuta]|nr:hypothetical protein F5B21DRAFT_270861 [Xylaria acuta]
MGYRYRRILALLIGACITLTYQALRGHLQFLRDAKMRQAMELVRHTLRLDCVNQSSSPHRGDKLRGQLRRNISDIVQPVVRKLLGGARVEEREMKKI